MTAQQELDLIQADLRRLKAGQQALAADKARVKKAQQDRILAECKQHMRNAFGTAVK